MSRLVFLALTVVVSHFSAFTVDAAELDIIALIGSTSSSDTYRNLVSVAYTNNDPNAAPVDMYKLLSTTTSNYVVGGSTNYGTYPYFMTMYSYEYDNVIVLNQTVNGYNLSGVTGVYVQKYMGPGLMPGGGWVNVRTLSSPSGYTFTP